MANLVTTISETLTLNGSLRGSTLQVTTSDINDVEERIVTCAHSQTTLLALELWKT
jgi:DNA helicase HerA-like ATPase